MQDKKDIVSAVMDVELIPSFPKQDLATKSNIKVPLTELAMGSAVFAHLANGFNVFANTTEVQSGVLYRFTSRGYCGGPTPLKDGSGFLSTVSKQGEGIIGQGAYVPVDGAESLASSAVAFDPITLAIAIALVEVNRKLDAIQATQEEIFEFMKEDKRSEIRGDAKMLSDALNNFKFNSDNSAWRSTRHQSLLDIKRRSEQHIEFYRALVEKKILKRGFLNLDKDIAKKTGDLIDSLSQYQSALYLLGFSTFLDVVFSENFDHAYLENVMLKLENYRRKYSQLYSDVYQQLNEALSSSAEGKLIGGIAGASSYLGKRLAAVPIIEQGPVDEALQNAGLKLEDLNNNRQLKAIKHLGVCCENIITPFVENIQLINNLHNGAPVFYLEDGVLYCTPEGALAS